MRHSGSIALLALAMLGGGAAWAAPPCVGPSCGLMLDHFKCYQARTTRGTSRFASVTVTETDEFETIQSLVRKPGELCNPVSKNGNSMFDPTAHLACYATKDARTGAFAKRDVIISNQFGVQRLTVQKPYQLCVPTEKGRAPSPPTPSALAVDHFRCFKAKPAKGSPLVDGVLVTLADQFETRNAVVKRCLRFCTPVSKNGEPLQDAAGHLTCYKLVRDPADTVPPFQPIDLNVTNQFGDDQLTARPLPHLCVPSLTSPSGAFVE